MWVLFICEIVGFDDLEFDLSEEPLVLGRSRQADVQIVHPLISRAHCEWKLVDGELVVRDLESTNQTLINGEPIGQAALDPGDRILLGDVLYIVEFEDDRVALPGEEGGESRDENIAPRPGSTHLVVKTGSSLIDSEGRSPH